jgi:hypothetical protein
MTQYSLCNVGTSRTRFKHHLSLLCNTTKHLEFGTGLSDLNIIILDIIQRHAYYLNERFGDWVHSPSSGSTYSAGPCVRSGTSSVDQAELRYHLKTETEISLRNALF